MIIGKFITKKNKIILSVVFFLILTALLIYQTIKLVKILNLNTEEIGPLYRYTNSSDITYKVYLKENPYFNQRVIGMDNFYVTELVDYIDLNVVYRFIGNGDINLSYAYDVEALVIGIYDETGNQERLEVWAKSFIVTETTENTINNDEFVITENLKIKLNRYNQEVSSFRDNLGIPIDALLRYNINIYMSGEVMGESFTGEKNITFELPLGVKTFAIDIPSELLEPELVEVAPQTNEPVDYQDLFIVLIVIILIITSGGIYIKYALIGINKSEYQALIEKIRKDYDYKIVQVFNFDNLPEYQYIDVINFEELLDLSEETGSPILSWGNNVDEMEETWFCVVKQKLIYRVIIKNEDNS